MQLKMKNLFVMLSVMLVLISIITAVMASVNLLPSQRFFSVWLSAFIFTFLELLPTGSGVLMAMIVESIMAVVLTIKIGSYGSLAHFTQLVLNNLLYALPVGITLPLAMTLMIKPQLEKYFPLFFV